MKALAPDNEISKLKLSYNNVLQFGGYKACPDMITHFYEYHPNNDSFIALDTLTTKTSPYDNTQNS
jgi:hypothetical protein